MKDLADEQSGFYREIGIFLRPATAPVLAGCHAARFSSANQIAISPRWRKPLLYSAQLVTSQALFRSCDGGSGYLCTISVLLQVNSPRITPDRPPSCWKIDLFNNAWRYALRCQQNCRRSQC